MLYPPIDIVCDVSRAFLMTMIDVRARRVLRTFTVEDIMEYSKSIENTTEREDGFGKKIKKTKTRTQKLFYSSLNSKKVFCSV